MFIVSLLDAVRHGFAEWRRKQLAYAELMSLDDRSLADIGIRRSDIPAVVEGFHEKARRPVEARDPAVALSARQAKLAFGGRWLPPI